MKTPIIENPNISIVLSHFDNQSNNIFKILHKYYGEIGIIQSDSHFEKHDLKILEEKQKNSYLRIGNFKECLEEFYADWKNIQYEKMIDFLKSGDKIKAMNIYRIDIYPDATLEEARFYIDNVNLIHE